MFLGNSEVLGKILKFQLNHEMLAKFCNFNKFCYFGSHEAKFSLRLDSGSGPLAETMTPNRDCSKMEGAVMMNDDMMTGPG